MFSSPAPAESETVIQKPASADIDHNTTQHQLSSDKATVLKLYKDVLQEATSADHITQPRIFM
jgi:hypothetical protein